MGVLAPTSQTVHKLLQVVATRANLPIRFSFLAQALSLDSEVNGLQQHQLPITFLTAEKVSEVAGGICASYGGPL
jgi:hypothetical protein